MGEALSRDLEGQDEEIRTLAARDPKFAAMVKRYEDLTAALRAKADGADRPAIIAERGQLLTAVADYMIEAEENIDDQKMI